MLAKYLACMSQTNVHSPQLSNVAFHGGESAMIVARLGMRAVYNLVTTCTFPVPIAPGDPYPPQEILLVLVNHSVGP